MYGPLSRVIDLSNSHSRDFWVANDGYAGVAFTTTGEGSGSGVVTVSTSKGDPPNVATPAGVLDRYWTITDTGLNLSGGINPTLTFYYDDTDFSGALDENTMVPACYSDGSWQELSVTSRDTSSNYVITAQISHFSVWTLANPSAVPVSVSSFSIE